MHFFVYSNLIKQSDVAMQANESLCHDILAVCNQQTTVDIRQGHIQFVLLTKKKTIHQPTTFVLGAWKK